jgi:hypothetical protein
MFMQYLTRTIGHFAALLRRGRRAPELTAIIPNPLLELV